MEGVGNDLNHDEGGAGSMEGETAGQGAAEGGAAWGSMESSLLDDLRATSTEPTHPPAADREDGQGGMAGAASASRPFEGGWGEPTAVPYDGTPPR